MTMHYEVEQFHRRCLRMVELTRSVLERRELAYLEGSLDMVKAEIRSLMESLAQREAAQRHFALTGEWPDLDAQFCGERCQRRTGRCTGCGDGQHTQVDGLCLACRDNNERAHSWCPEGAT